LLPVVANQAKSFSDQVRGLPICVHTPLARRWRAPVSSTVILAAVSSPGPMPKVR
jgi:hypothetical protein